MTVHFQITCPAYFDTVTKRDMPAASLVMNGEARVADFLRRSAACGCNAVAVELTAEQYRAIALARMPGK